MQEYNVLGSKILFKETGFIFHISREYFKPVKVFRKIIHILFLKIALVVPKLHFHLFCGFNLWRAQIEIPIRDKF